MTNRKVIGVVVYLFLNFISMNFSAASDDALYEEEPLRMFNLKSSHKHVGHLKKVRGESIYEDIVFVRNHRTPRKVTLTFFFKFVETVCDPDGGWHGGGGWGWGWGWGGGAGSHCRKWKEVYTSRPGKLLLDFLHARRLKHGDKEKVIVSFIQQGERKTKFTFYGMVEGYEDQDLDYKIEKIYKWPQQIGLRFFHNY